MVEQRSSANRDGWQDLDVYKRQETEQALTKQEEMLKRLFYNGVQSGVKLERLKETMRITTLDRDTLLALSLIHI